MKKIREKLDVYLNNLKIKRKIFLLYFYCVVLPLVLTDTVICGMFVHDEKEAREARLKNMVKSVEYMLNSAAEEAAALSENIYFNKYIKGKAWYEKFLASGQEMQMYFYFEASGTTNLKLPRKASFVRKLDRYKRDPYQKLLKIDLDYAGINQNLIMSNYEDEVYVCQGEKIIFSNSRKLNPQQDFEKITEVRRKKGEYVESFHLFGQDLDVYAIPQQGNFLQGILQHWPSIVLLILFNVLIPCVFMQALRRTFTERLEILNRTINYRDKGKLGEIQGIQGTDEIAVLMRNYNNMVEENNHLIETVYKSRLKQQEINIARQKAELLENIRMRSVLKQEYETAEMIEQLSIMERQYVEWGTDLLPISEEQKFVEAYLKLQKYRFGNRLSYTIEIEEGCEAYKIPKLSLVTFVENACVHGIEDKATQCWIFVRVYQKQEELYMEIEDTGSGMPEAYLSILREKMEHASIEMLKQKGSVGMVNACLRLKMYTEERVKILLESEECVGTMVTISIPVHALK